MSDLSPEAEEELLKKTARFIVDHGLTQIAEMFLPIYGQSEYIGTTLFTSALPFAVAFFGTQGLDYISLLGLNPKVNIKRLLTKIREAELDRTRALLEKQGPLSQQSLMQRIKNFLLKIQSKFKRGE